MPAPAGNKGQTSGHIVVGRISGIFGTRGWLKVSSFTRPPAGILEYKRWRVGVAQRCFEFQVEDCQFLGRSLRVRLNGVDDRDAARLLIGSDIAIDRSELPALPAGQHYWCDLIGLEVRDLGGRVLGTVEDIWETGANDVLVVEGGERMLIPYVPGRFIKKVDLAGRSIEVDWVPGYF
ncbi:MAG: 16S rRNA processing protein RimM [Gammaproteobacteria bacterium]|nr:16S rRNA processing protein RimM [Gammaproteobacteria bacterium]